LSRSRLCSWFLVVGVAVATVAGPSGSMAAAPRDVTVSSEYAVSDPVPGRASVDASLPSVATAGTSSLVVWRELNAIVGGRVTRAGTVLDPHGIAIASDEGSNPDVAAGSSQYLVAWTTAHGIRAARLSPTGKLLDQVPIAVRDGLAGAPSVAVAFDGTNYRVAWNEIDVPANRHDILASRVSTAGAVLDATPITVSDAAFDQLAPDVAFDGSNYLVVWQDFRGSTRDVYASRVSPAGVVLDPSGLAVSTASRDQTSPAVVWGGTEYLVAWSDARAGPGKQDLYAARVSADGVVLDPSGFAVSVAAFNQADPAVDFDGTNFLVGWTDARDDEFAYHVYAARVAPDGTVLDPSGIPVATDVLMPPAPPAVVWTGRSHLVAWGTGDPSAPGDVIARRMTAAGHVEDPSGIAVSLGANSQAAPAIASDGTDELIAWLDQRVNTDGSFEEAVYAGRVSASGQILDGTGLRLSASTTAGLGGADVAFDGTNYLVVWAQPNGSFGDILGVRIAPDGTIVDPTPIVLARSTSADILDPHVASNGTNWEVAWLRFPPATGLEIRAESVRGDGTVARRTLVSTDADANSQVDVGTDGTGYLVAWASHYASSDVLGARLTASGKLIDVVAIPISTASSIQWTPSVSNGSDPYLVTWEDWRNPATQTDVYGARVASDGSVLDPAGIAVSTGADSEFLPSATWDGTNWLVALGSVEPGRLIDHVLWARVAADGTVLDVPANILSDSWDSVPAGATSESGTVGVAYQRLVAGPPDNAMRMFIRFVSE